MPHRQGHQNPSLPPKKDEHRKQCCSFNPFCQPTESFTWSHNVLCRFFRGAITEVSGPALARGFPSRNFRAVVSLGTIAAVLRVHSSARVAVGAQWTRGGVEGPRDTVAAKKECM